MPTGPAQWDGVWRRRPLGFSSGGRREKEGAPAGYHPAGYNMLPAIFLPLAYVPLSQWLAGMLG